LNQPTTGEVPPFLVEAISMEGYPVLYCGYHSAWKAASSPPTCGALRARGAAHTACWRTRGPLAHLLSCRRIGLPPARGTKPNLGARPLKSRLGRVS
jgi:hypothetical protein